MAIIWTKKMRRIMKQVAALKDNGGYDVTVENAGYRRALDRAWENGRIGVITSSIDCDGTQGYYERIETMPNAVIAIKRLADAFYENLEGPGTIRFVKPEEIDRSRSYTRDLALEAYEDGHPHVIYA